jgi:hypothetical protein
MTADDIKNFVDGVSRWDESRYRLSDSQIREVVRIQGRVLGGKAIFATDEEMGVLWKSCDP